MKRWWGICGVLTILFACGLSAAKKHKSSVSKSTTDIPYDLHHPSKEWSLPDSLKEVSGVAVADEQHLLLIEDLHPKLYYFNTSGTGHLEKTVAFLPTSSDKFDIEDVALHDDTAYALWSHGVVYRVGHWLQQPQTDTLATALTKKQNTEGLCYDPLSRQLLIACKNKTGLEEEKKGTHAVYALDPHTGSLQEEPALLVHRKDFKKQEGEKVDFFPSAIAVHPLSHHYYLLSSRANKLLGVYSREGALLQVKRLDEKLLPQPEGLAFDSSGNMYISTQGRHGQPARLVMYRLVKE